MNKFLPFRIVGTVISFLLLVGVIGAGLYFDRVLAKVEKLPVTTTAYPLSAITNEMKPGQIFDKTKDLVPIPLSENEAVQYQESDLGKTDISQFN